MLLDVIEKPAAGKFPSHDQGRAASKRRQRAQGLGRTPVVGAKIVDAIGAAYAKGIRGRLGVAQQFPKAQHHALRQLGRARGEQDDGVILAARVHACIARLALADRGIKAAAFRAVPGSERKTRRRCHAQDRLEVQSLFEDDEPGVERRKNTLEVMAVHLHVDGADGCAIGHDAEVTRQMLD